MNEYLNLLHLNGWLVLLLSVTALFLTHTLYGLLLRARTRQLLGTWRWALFALAIYLAVLDAVLILVKLVVIAAALTLALGGKVPLDGEQTLYAYTAIALSLVLLASGCMVVAQWLYLTMLRAMNRKLAHATGDQHARN